MPRYKQVSIDSLHEDPKNARAHPERNKAAVRASLEEFGQVEPLVVQAGTGLVIGGNARLGELRAMGVEDVMVAEVEIDGPAMTKLALALNRSAEMAEWDADALGTLLAEIGRDAAEEIGFDDDIDSLLASLDDDGSWGDIGVPGSKENAIKDPVVAVMIHCKRAEVVERAIEDALLSGAPSRGEALELICKEWSDGR
jgi:hypothetical protein